MSNRTHVMDDRRVDVDAIADAKQMAGWLLAREHRGPGDTIDAAAYRLQTKYGVPSALLMRLRHREVKDMLLSNFVALANAYREATRRAERAYQHEREISSHPTLVRYTDALAGKEAGRQGAEE